MPCFSKDNPPLIQEKQPVKSFFEDVNFSLGTGLSYLSGQYREIVYTNTNSANPYLSELLWNLDNIFLLNFTASANKGHWSMNLSISTAVTKGSGIMEDYDWGDYTITDWTNWSESLIFIDKSFFLDLSSGYKYTLNDHIAFPMKLGYKLNYLDWEDKSGEYIYYWNFDPAVNDYYTTVQTGDFGGVNGIDYKVIQNIFYASSGILFTNENISTGLNIYLSPLIYAWDLDHHILRSEAPYFFLDSFSANFWYKTELILNITTGAKSNLVISAFLEELPESEGDTYYFDKDPSDSEEVGDQVGYYQNGAGMASYMWGIELSYIWTF